MSFVRFGQEGRDLCVAKHTLGREQTTELPNSLSTSGRQSGFIRQDQYVKWMSNASEECWANSCVGELDWWARRSLARAENAEECAARKVSEQNGGYDLINSAWVWQQQSWSSLPAAEWRDGMCERSAEMHSSTSSSSSLTADLNLHALQEFH